MLKNLARVVAAGAFVLAAVVPTTASAAGGGGSGAPGAITITIAPTVTVDDRQLLTMTVTTTCPLLVQYPGGPPLTSFYPNGNGNVQEVIGNVIAHSFMSGWTSVCDGVSRTITMSGLAWNMPFHPGTGFASAFASPVCGFDPVANTFGCIQGSAIQAVNIVAIH